MEDEGSTSSFILHPSTFIPSMTKEEIFRLTQFARGAG
jgi:hypothetical protein